MGSPHHHAPEMSAGSGSSSGSESLTPTWRSNKRFPAMDPMRQVDQVAELDVAIGRHGAAAARLTRGRASRWELWPKST